MHQKSRDPPLPSFMAKIMAEIMARFHKPKILK